MSSWENRFENWGYPANFFMVIGAVEVICAVLIFFPKLAGYAAAVLSIVMISASIILLPNSLSYFFQAHLGVF